jgi:hypothetical protein
MQTELKLRHRDERAKWLPVTRRSAHRSPLEVSVTPADSAERWRGLVHQGWSGFDVSAARNGLDRTRADPQRGGGEQ